MIVMILTVRLIDYINVTHGPCSQYQSIIPSEKLRNNPLLNTLRRGGTGQWTGQKAPVAPGERSELLLDFQMAALAPSFTSSLHVNTRLNVVLLGEVPELTKVLQNM